VGTLGLFVLAANEGVLVARAVQGGWYGPLAVDFDLYRAYARSWLDGHGWYLEAQLAAPYVVEDVSANVYPPTLLYLTVPFALGLPAALWWAIPLGIIAVTFWSSRPAWWAWSVVGLVLIFPRTWTILVTGNPSMWAIAFATAGVVWGWPAVGAALKLTLAPLAFLGLRRRSWWMATGLAILVALPFGTLWLDYLTILQHAESSRGFVYLFGEWPIALALVAVALSGVAQPEDIAEAGEVGAVPHDANGVERGWSSRLTLLQRSPGHSIPKVKPGID
jgi:hypothetical protein